MVILGIDCLVSLVKKAIGIKNEEESTIETTLKYSFINNSILLKTSTIENSVMFYTRDTKTPHAEFMENGLGCTGKMTATEKKLTFQDIVKDAIGEDDEESETVFLGIQGSIHERIPVAGEDEAEPEPASLTTADISEVLTENGCSEEQVSAIKKQYEDAFRAELPEAEQLVEPKLVEENTKRKERLELMQQVENLKQQLEEVHSDLSDEKESADAIKTYDVILRVKPEKVGQIHSDVINGKKCLIIPMEEDEHATVNGVNTTV